MYCFSNSFFVVKCVLVSLKVLDHSYLNTSLVQLNFFLIRNGRKFGKLYILKMKILMISL